MTDLNIPLKIPLKEVERHGRKHTVLLTGGTSYVAGHILHRLLANEIHVHATVRDPSDSKVKYLRSLPNGETHLTLFKADLLKDGSFDEPMQGCDAVIHTASPYVLSIPPGKERELLHDPALKGTENVLASVERTPTVKRVVLTSSVAALYGAPDERGVDHAFDEHDWGLVPKENVLPYFYSKKIAEQRAWEIHDKQSRWKLVTVLPGQVWGPPLSARHKGAESVKMMVSMLSGFFFPAAPPIGLGFVDVRDVAQAHSLALLDPRAKGRYIAVSHSLNFLEMAAILKQKYPSYWLPFLKAPYSFIYAVGPYFGLPRDLIKYSYGKTPMFDTRKAQEELGIRFLSPEVMLWDEAQRLHELGLVKRWFGLF